MNHHNSSEIIKNIDHALVDYKYLGPLSALFFGLFSERSYPRNENAKYIFIMCCIGTAMLVLPTYAIYYYFPLKFTVAPIFFGPLLGCLLLPIIFANQSLSSSLLYVLVSTYCYFQHWNLGITLFTFHLEHYIFTAFLVTSILGLVRRGWNAYVWWQLDRITLRYCRKNNIAVSGEA